MEKNMKKKILMSLAITAVMALSASAFTQDDAIVYRGAGSWFCDYSVQSGFGDAAVDTSLTGFGFTTFSDIGMSAIVDVVVV